MKIQTAFGTDDYNHISMANWIHSLAAVLSYKPSPEHAWHDREQRKYPMHDSVFRAVKLARPSMWHQLVLEWPHVSETDPNRIAYTRDDRAGTEDRQTVTTIGKYLRRHFSTLRDDQIRDIVALYASDGCEVVKTMDGILTVLQNGPQSCMKWRDCHAEHHPYRVYDPAYGWGMAQRVVAGDVVGRAIVYEDADEGVKCYVRSYKKAEGYSPADEILEAWLKEQGYHHHGQWPQGARLAYVEGKHSSFTAPYIDGDCQKVTLSRNGGKQCLIIDEDGEYLCNNTDGTVDDESGVECECCGDTHDEDDSHFVGRNEDIRICGACFDYNYVSAISRRGYEHYLHRDDTVWVESQDANYDTDYLTSNGIIQLDNGDYEHTDNAVELSSRDVWVHMDDGDAVYCEHNDRYEHIDDCVQLHDGNYALTDDAWQCEHDDAWYLSENDKPVEVKDVHGNVLQVHPDHADEYAADEEEPTESESI